MQLNHMKKQYGLTLVELMIAVTLGLILLLGLATIYERNSVTRNELERSSRQLENGRYALQLLSSDIKLAGYLGEFYATTAPASLPANPCSNTLADLQSAFPLHVQGYDNGSGSLPCISDYKGGDVIVVRRVSTCSAANPADTGCEAITSGLPYFQVSGCSTDATPTFRLDTNIDNLILKKIGCTNTASQRRLLTHIYYVANNNLGSDGIPTLKRWELGSASNPVPLVEGIENLQFEYGIDSDGDGAPNSYSSSPATVGNWFNVVAVKIHLLSRNETQSLGYVDNKFYMLGDTRIPASDTFGDAYRRHAYSTTIVLENPAGRRQ